MTNVGGIGSDYRQYSTVNESQGGVKKDADNYSGGLSLKDTQLSEDKFELNPKNDKKDKHSIQDLYTSSGDNSFAEAVSPTAAVIGAAEDVKKLVDRKNNE